MKQWLVLVVALSSSWQAFGASDDWTGMWRVSRFFEGKFEGVVHIRVTDDPVDRIQVYDQTARPMILQEVSLQADSLELQVAHSAIQPLPLAFKLTREQRRLSGSWVFSQFQLGEPLEGTASGFQVFSSAAWEPWAAVEQHRSDGVVDLLGLALKSAPLNNFRNFESFWKEKVETPYYFVVESWLYGDGRQWERQRQQTLAALFESLKKRGPARDLLVQFQELGGKAVALAPRDAEDQGTTFLVSFFGSAPQAASRLWIRVPTEEEEARCACKLDLRESFVFLNPTHFVRGESGSTLLLKAMLREVAWGRFATGMAIEVFRQAWALEKALEASGLAVPQLDSGMVNLMRDTFGPRLLSAGDIVPGEGVNEERVVAECLSFVLGRAFLAWLRGNRPDADVLKLDDRALMQAWMEYLTGTQAASSSVRARNP